MSATGNWNLTMSTPMGEQTAVLAVSDGSATMTGTDGVVQPCQEFKAEGDKLTWKIPVTKPVPLTLHFDVNIEGDTLTGKFRPGMFPASPVSGVRA